MSSWPSIDPAALRDTVRFETPSAVRDAEGGMQPGWTAVATVWASVKPASGRELQAAGKQFEDVETVITIRFLDGLNSSMRAIHVDSGDEYDIRSVIDVDSRRVLHKLGCRRRI